MWTIFWRYGHLLYKGVMHTMNENRLVVTANRSLKDGSRCRNNIVVSLGLGVVSQLFGEEQRFR